MPPKRASRSKAAVAAAVAAASAASAAATAESSAAAETAAEPPPPIPTKPNANDDEPAVILHIPHVPSTPSAAIAAGAADGAGPPGIGDACHLEEVPPPEEPSGGAEGGGAARMMVMRGFDGYVWPRSTSIACFWCCHAFEGQPVGLPLRHAANVFYVWGCFCSLECALALNRHERRGFPAAESTNLLQLLTQAVGRLEPLRPAPDRCLLSMFGGPLSIQEFRALAPRVINVHLPPMMAVVPTVEEVTSSSAGALTRQDHRIPLDMARIKNATDKARGGARRAAKNTLEAAMPNLRVTG